MNGWSESLRQQLQPGVRVIVIEPGAVATELTDHITHGETKTAVEQMYEATSIAPAGHRRDHRLRRLAAAQRVAQRDPRPPHRTGAVMTIATTPTLELNNGVTMPALGLGVFQSPPEETVSAVETALRDGYRLIDTAAAYDNEREVGEGIRRSGVDRDEIFVTTKLWISDYGYDAAAGRLRRQPAPARRRLRRPVPAAPAGADRLRGRPSAPTRPPRRSSPTAGRARSASRTSASEHLRQLIDAHRRRAGGQPGRAAPLLHAARAAAGSTPSSASPPRPGRRSAASSSTCPAATRAAAR